MIIRATSHVYVLWAPLMHTYIVDGWGPQVFLVGNAHFFKGISYITWKMYSQKKNRTFCLKKYAFDLKNTFFLAPLSASLRFSPATNIAFSVCVWVCLYPPHEIYMFSHSEFFQIWYVISL